MASGRGGRKREATIPQMAKVPDPPDMNIARWILGQVLSLRAIYEARDTLCDWHVFLMAAGHLRRILNKNDIALT